MTVNPYNSMIDTRMTDVEIRQFKSLWLGVNIRQQDILTHMPIIKSINTPRTLAARLGLPLWDDVPKSYKLRTPKARTASQQAHSKRKQTEVKEPVSDNLAMRKCISCRVQFQSTHSGHRQCGCNKDNSAHGLSRQWEYA